MAIGAAVEGTSSGREFRLLEPSGFHGALVRQLQAHAGCALSSGHHLKQ
jgi:hypothetical protein